MSDAGVVIVDDRTRDRAEVLDRAARAATGLDGLGLGPKSIVALLLRNDFAALEMSVAASTVGAYNVPLNWHNKPDELAYVLNDSVPSVLVGHADLLLAAREVLPAGVVVLVVPLEGSAATDCATTAEALAAMPGARTWDEFVAGNAPWAQPPRPSGGAIIYTSGTTGRPKGVVKFPMTDEVAARFVETQRRVWGMSTGARGLVLGPIYHASPEAQARAALAEAELLVLQSRFDPEAVLAAIERHRITDIVIVPTMFVRMLRLPEEVRNRYDVSSLRWVTHTGGPCPPDVKRAMIDWWGPIINELYGGTEMGCAFFCDSAEWLAHPGTVGRALPGLRFEIVGADGEAVPAGQVGEIYARNPAYGEFTYLGLDDQRQAIARGDLITLGDMGYVDDDGFLYLTDRSRDMVVSGGVNIYPAEIEAALLGFDQVVDCAVFGVPDDVFGESVMVAVQAVPGSGLTADAVREYLRGRISDYKVPRHVTFHDRLPREETGKLFKRKLRDPYWSEIRRTG
ncbi:acyl-CoA synthetase [Pseudonocardia halophobica]|uniref:Acyl-CoA synthetase n=1 Tax=Pseudonocardia halophobica TaxID=29401 RepID=A0A9W6NUW8_9PSEU|nr:AMP-binding protein [Pseudonocardia halophobica]GLL09777.1 acyl-CoA synthetase [Pseudonocardia halophobica]